MPHDSIDRDNADRQAHHLAVHLRPGRADDRPGDPQGPAVRGTRRSTAAATPVAAWRSTSGGQPLRRFRRQQLVAGLERLLRQQLDARSTRASRSRTRAAPPVTRNNLNGKIIRIHPEADGTYTIPQGNLFPGGRPGDKTRPEIYVMGVRNISRLADRPGARLADRRVGRAGRVVAEPGARSGEVRDRDDHHRGGQPRLAVLHGQQAALPRPQQHRRGRPDGLVRLRQPAQHLAAQHRPGEPAAGARRT